jgi:hypothetical protein
MRQFVLMLAAAGAFVALAPSAEACSIRGQYCGHPSWAANVFEGRYGFKGNPAILTDHYVGHPPRKVRRVYVEKPSHGRKH